MFINDIRVDCTTITMEHLLWYVVDIEQFDIGRTSHMVLLYSRKATIGNVTDRMTSLTTSLDVSYIICQVIQ